MKTISSIQVSTKEECIYRNNKCIFSRLKINSYGEAYYKTCRRFGGTIKGIDRIDACKFKHPNGVWLVIDGEK